MAIKRGFERCTLVVLAVSTLACAPDLPPTPVTPTVPATTVAVHFADVGTDSGLDFAQISGGPQQRYILAAMTGGGAFLDYDNDGWLDIFLVNGTTFDATFPTASNGLYRNIISDGSRAFADFTDAAGLRRSGWGTGCAVGDYDNDGDVDLYTTYWGPNVLYRNDGDGHLSDATDVAGVGDQRWGASAAFGDIDADGQLDLYVTNYLKFDLAAPPNGGELCRGWKGLETFCGPHGMTAQADVLYRNEGDGRFADISESTGIAQHAYPGLGVVCTDYDNDGDADIYVANDSQPNLLYRNDGDWHLAELGAFAGVAYSEEGRAQAGMGVDAGDYDNDGDIDLFATNFSDDVNTLYQNLAGRSFADATPTAGLGGEDRPLLGWSTALFDADNDGWLDLYVANGHLYPQLNKHPAGLRYAQPNLLYWNKNGRFRRADPQRGLAAEKVSRGTAFGDYDNDGDIDLLVINLNDAPTLLRNDGGNGHNWLGFELEGVESNRDGIGAQLRLFYAGGMLLRELKRGYGYQSAHDGRVLFGLGRETSVERVEIRWPSGRLQTIANPPLRTYLQVRENGAEQIAPYTNQTPESPAPSAAHAVAATSPSAVEARNGPTPLPDPRSSPWRAADYYRHGVKLYQQARYEEAVQAFATALEDNYAPAYYSMGVVLYSGLGRSEEAANLLREAVARDSSRVELFELLGRIYLSLDQAQPAAAALVHAVALDPASWERHYRLGLAYQRGSAWSKAAKAMQRAAQLAPWAPMPHLHLSRIYQELDQEDLARKERLAFARLKHQEQREDSYLQQIKSEPIDAEAHYQLGREYMKQQRYSTALTYFARATQLNPNYGLAHYGKASAHYYQQQLPEAIAAYQTAYRADSSLVMALSDLGRAYHRAGRLPAAVESYQRAIQLRPDLALARSGLGQTLAAQGKTHQAIAALSQALAIDSTLVETRAGLARLLAAEGQLEQAIAEWEKILWLAPEHPRARAWIEQAQQALAARRARRAR